MPFEWPTNGLNSIRIKADVDPNENTWPFSSSQRDLVKVLFLTNNQLILFHGVVNHTIRLFRQTQIFIICIQHGVTKVYICFTTNGACDSLRVQKYCLISS